VSDLSKTSPDDVPVEESGISEARIERNAVPRYSGFTRLNHWVMAAALMVLAVSGMSLFWPSLFWLSGLFGGGANTRAIHPWIGVFLFFSFGLMFLRFWKLNLPTREDGVWLSKIKEVVKADEEHLPELGKYNPGQKLVFWGMGATIFWLFVTGLMIWDEYFAQSFSIEMRRYAVLVHSLAAIGAITIWILHFYAAIWVKGTIRGMTRGDVTAGWAYRHHRKWLRQESAKHPVQPAE
jgi:formate dehydrogenase subunit gamma